MANSTGGFTFPFDIDIKNALAKAKELQKEVKEIINSRTGEESPALQNIEIQLKKLSQATSTVCFNIRNLQKQLDSLNYDTLEHASYQIMQVSTELEAQRAKADDIFSGYETALYDVMAQFQTELRGETVSVLSAYQAGLNGDAEAAQVAADAMKQFNDEMANTQVSFNGQSMTLSEASDFVDSYHQGVMRLINEEQQLAQTLELPKEAFDSLAKLESVVDMKMSQLGAQYDDLTAKIREQAEALEILNIKQGMQLAKHTRQQNKDNSDGQPGVVPSAKGIHDVSRAVRGLSRLIPGVNSRMIWGVSMASEGLMGVTRLTKEQLLDGLKQVGDMFKKIGQLILSHPVISAALAAAVAAVVAIVKEVKQIKKVLESLGKFILSGIKKIAKAGLSLLKSLVKGAGKLGMVIPVTSVSLVKKLVDALKSLKGIIQENLGLMAKWNLGVNDVNKALSNITSSLAYLKATLATAIAPVLVQLEPLITSITNRLAEMTTTIGMLIAKLTGSNTFLKAIRIQKDYAKSIDNSSKSLASFDKLNVLNNDDKAVDFELADLEETEIPNWFDDLEGLGKKVGQAITDFLTNIPWDTIIGKASTLGKSIADFLNGLLSVEGLGASIGRTFGEIINTFSKFTTDFLDKFDGKQLGKTIADGISSIVDTVNFTDLGNIFSGSINELADVIIGFTNNFDGAEFGTKITEFLESALGNISWIKVQVAAKKLVGDLVSTLNEVITPENFALVANTISGVLDTIFGALDTFNDMAAWDTWADSLSEGINTLFGDADKWAKRGETLSNLATNLTDMLLKAVQGIEWDKVADSLVSFISNIDWAKLAEDATKISRELLGALKEVWAKLADSDAFDEIINAIADFLKEKKNWTKAFKKIKRRLIWEILWERIKGGLEDIGESIVRTLSATGTAVYDALTAMFTFIGDFFSEAWDKIVNKTVEKFTAVKETILGIWDNITAGATNLKTSALDAFTALKTGISNIWTAITTKFTAAKEKLVAVWDKIKETVTDLKDSIIEKFTDIKTEIKDIWDNIADFVIGAWDTIKEGVKTPINAFLGMIEGFINKVIDGFNWMIEKLNKISFTVPDWVPDWMGGGGTFGIDISPMSKISIPRLAQGAVIPPNMSNFLAMLGDNNKETEIVSPLSTIEQALRNVLGEQNINVTFKVEGDPNGLFKVVRQEAKAFKRRTNIDAFGGA